MNINAGIIDQQVRGLAQKLKRDLESVLDKSLDETAANSAAFVVLCVKVMLDLVDAEAIDRLTEGGNDFGVDAIDVGDLRDGEFLVTLFQAKYHHQNLDGTKGFPQSGVEKAVQAVQSLFDPAAQIVVNNRLRTQLEEVRSLIQDGNIPRVRFLLCSNGSSWKVPEAEDIIVRAQFGDRVAFEHVSHDVLVRILQSQTPVKDTLHLAGKAIVEDFNFSRVLVGKVPVTELSRLMGMHGDRLLERNIRRYLGLHGNRVNENISSTLKKSNERPNFYFYNNGVTFICERFNYNALQREDYKVQVEGLQIINGGQTSKTIHATLAELQAANALGDSDGMDSAYVLVRLYQVPQDAKTLVQTITYATNSQNPVDLRDLRSNDERQKQLELSMGALGFEYRRQRTEAASTPNSISVGTAAEAVLSVWRRHPQQAKFRSGEHFGKLYNEIFTEALNATQVVVAVLLFRIAENKRKRPPPGSPDFVQYASCFAAMLMGQYLLQDLETTVDGLDHRNFESARRLIEAHGDSYFGRAVTDLQDALDKLYSGTVTLQRLSATFRRGDLFEYLPGGVRG
jgi:AIPR protein